MGNYDDIINLKRPISKHPKMSLYQRSAQFAPFAALTGYEDAIDETARLTNERIDLDEEAKMMLDAKLQVIREQLSEKPLVTITYFVPDARKSGGKYITTAGNVKKIDDYKHLIIFDNGVEIPIDEIIDITLNNTTEFYK